jgi:hypothetical protein
MNGGQSFCPRKIFKKKKNKSEALAFIDGAWLAKEWTNSAIIF